jgi:beta-aspartyl-peptidase (threonine type)
MKRVGNITGVLLLVLLTLLPGQGIMAAKTKKAAPKKAEASAKKTDSRAAIRAVLDNQVAAWNRGDLKGYMLGYWHSDELTFFGASDETKGWDGAFQRYSAAFLGKDKQMGELAFTDIQLETLGSQAAYARGGWQLTLKDGTKRNGLFTLILKKLPEGWRIVHDHSS